jgi:uncharacterized protein YwgA
MSDDEIDGRKRFQKKVCILKHKYNIPFRYEFTPLDYGPFSETLAVAIDTLVNMGYINEERHRTHSDFIQYTYRLTPEGRIFAAKQLERIKRENPPIYSVLSSTVNELKKLETPELVRLSKDAIKSMYV